MDLNWIITSVIRLNKSTTKLEFKLDGAGTDVIANVFYYDVKARAKPDNSEYQGAWQGTASAGTTETTICSAPDNNVVRNIDTIQIYNGNVGTKVVTVQIDDGGANTILLVKSLTAGQNLIYDAGGAGWQIL